MGYRKTIPALFVTLVSIIQILFTACSSKNEDDPAITYRLTLTAQEGGTVESAKTSYSEGEEVAIIARANDNYTFAGWYEEENQVSTDAEYHFPMPAHDLALTAYFSRMQQPTPEYSKILIVYFSRAGENWQVGNVSKGNTAVMAEYIEEHTGADLFEIVPKTPYPADYASMLTIARDEIDNNARPEILNRLENLDSYTTVFIGSPIWHGVPPMIMRTFYETYPSLEQKTLIPFGTHGGSGIGSCTNLIKEYFPNAIMLESFGISGSSIRDDDASTKVKAWLERIGIINNN